MLEQTQNWESREISEEAQKTAKHIGIVSQGAIQVLIEETRQDEREILWQQIFGTAEEIIEDREHAKRLLGFIKKRIEDEQ